MPVLRTDAQNSILLGCPTLSALPFINQTFENMALMDPGIRQHGLFVNIHLLDHQLLRMSLRSNCHPCMNSAGPSLFTQQLCLHQSKRYASLTSFYFWLSLRRYNIGQIRKTEYLIYATVNQVIFMDRKKLELDTMGRRSFKYCMHSCFNQIEVVIYV